MKLATAVLLLACSLIVCAEVITVAHIIDTPNPNDIFKQVQFKPLNALSYAEPQVIVSLDQINVEYNGVAYELVKKLYPQFIAFPVARCSYSTLGLIRYYSFSFDIQKDTKIAKVAVQTANPNKHASSGDSQDQKDGYEQISIEWAQKQAKISYGLNVVIKSNWNVIGGNALAACWSRPINGLYSYRFYFHNVKGKFEYNESSQKESKDDSKYYIEVAPVFTVASAPSQYKSLSLEEFKNNPAYPKIVQALNKELGRFNEKWIVDFQVAIINQTDCYKVVIDFQPFLLKQTYEAYYYGSVQKAALLKVDQRTFNGNGKSFTDWQSIEKFDSYKAFHDAHAYILSQFTWLRFYKVVSAYSALHKTGRYVRLVYGGIAENNIDPGNQINIVSYIDECGNYFMDRNDFLATHLNSYGRNDWVSLFIQTPDVSKAKFYQQIVKFFNSIYPKFWGANQLVDIKFKDNLHVIQFKNPTNLHHAVLQVDESNTALLNKVNWTKLSNDSPLIARVQNYAKGKYNASNIMFIQFQQDRNGTHFEVSYLDSNHKYNAAYILYIQATDVFTDNKVYSFNPATYSNFPLPADLKTSIRVFLTEQDTELIAIVGFIALSPNSFAVVGISTSGRWSITIQWIKAKWLVVSRQPAGDGYFRALGYPSSLIASCSGFLSRLYPAYFSRGYVYVTIETRTVGVNIYARIVYKFADRLVQSVVQLTYGVENSHVLNEWIQIDGVRLLDDYGYGRVYDYSYDVDASKFYLISTPRAEVVNVIVSADCGIGLRRNIFNLCEPVFKAIAN